MHMTGDTYELALSLAHDDVDLLEDLHEAIMANGISDETYAKAFALMYGRNRAEEAGMVFSKTEKVWKRGGRTLSDMKLFTALNKACELVRAYTLASWENCVFSAWVPKKEVQKAEEKMDAQESIAHAKAILALAADMMEGECPGSPKIDWEAEEEEPEPD